MGHPTATDDYYEILQLSPKADQETIERVYRLLPFSKDFTTDFDSYIEKLTRIPDFAKTQ